MKFLFNYLFLLLGLWSCEEKLPALSDENSVLAASLPEVEEFVSSIDNNLSKIVIEVKNSTAVSDLLVSFELSDDASISPAEGTRYDLSSPKTVVVTSQSGKERRYRLSVVQVEVPALISKVSIPSLYLDGTNAIKGDTIQFSVPVATDVTKLVMEATLVDGAVSTPAFGIPTDFTNPVHYKVKNSKGFSRTYIANIIVSKPKREIRGVWLADPRFTNVLKSYEGVQDFINLMDELNMNTIYVSVWTLEKTLFKSQVLKNNTNYGAIEDGWMLKNYPYSSPSNDAIKDLIELAHVKNMKVIFWFEYGFMRSGNASVDVNSHPILSVHPEWDGKGSDGRPANYNNSDFYLNSFDPEVQDFLLDLIEESLDLYPMVDGIQGDDRMPASPINSGYNDVTREQYKKEKGVYPPSNTTDAVWKRWRLDNLNAFGREMYRRIKAKGDQYIVCFSPNPYPWCEDALMQDWPQWIRDGIVEILSVQCYRTDKYAYRQTIEQVLSYVKKNTSKNIFNPGIYFRTTTFGWETFFHEQMNINREFGTNGETFFYNEGLKSDVNKRVIKQYYPQKALFPEL